MASMKRFMYQMNTCDGFNTEASDIYRLMWYLILYYTTLYFIIYSVCVYIDMACKMTLGVCLIYSTHVRTISLYILGAFLMYTLNVRVRSHVSNWQTVTCSAIKSAFYSADPLWIPNV